MSNQLHAERATHKQEDWDDIEHLDGTAGEKARELSAETEALLDEIDDLLGEVDAQELVSGFVQQNGQ